MGWFGQIWPLHLCSRPWRGGDILGQPWQEAWQERFSPPFCFMLNRLPRLIPSKGRWSGFQGGPLPWLCHRSGTTSAHDERLAALESQPPSAPTACLPPLQAVEKQQQKEEEREAQAQQQQAAAENLELPDVPTHKPVLQPAAAEEEARLEEPMPAQ